MSIKINNQDIVAINKGNQAIIEVYKGSDLIWQSNTDPLDKIIYFADPEVGRVLHTNGLIANANKSSKRELATITSLNPDGGITTSYFYNNEVITKFPELQYCTGLSELRYAFFGCSNLTEVGTIPESVTNMYGTFEHCSSLVNAPIIPESVTNMYGTFAGCSSLVEAPTIPESVTNMYYTFYGCSNLDGIFVIKPINPPTYNNTFENANVVAIYVPDESVNTYKNTSGWSDYSSNIYPMSSIGMDDIIFADPEVGRVLKSNGLIADANISSIEELATITSLSSYFEGTSYFEGNRVITKFPELKYCTGLSELRYTFFGCSNLTEVGTIPDSVTDMNYTFNGCESLVNAPIIPNSVTSMRGTFRSCSKLTEAPIIPSSVIDMRSTFVYCYSLDGVFVIKRVTPPTYSDTFYGTNVVAIYVPDESVSIYKSRTGWSAHSSKIKPMSELPQ